jgi:hypothetical protein
VLSLHSAKVGKLGTFEGSDLDFVTLDLDFVTITGDTLPDTSSPAFHRRQFPLCCIGQSRLAGMVSGHVRRAGLSRQVSGHR